MHWKSISGAEVTRIGAEGIRVRVEGREFLLDYGHFPWFRGAPAGDVRHVVTPHPGHLRWPRLDVDLTLDSIERPEHYPLTARVRGSA